MRSFEPLDRKTRIEDIAIEEGDQFLDMSLLDILSKHVVSYPALIRFISNEILMPSEILTPSGLDKVVSELNQNSTTFLEAMNFADTLSLLDILHYGGNGNSVLNLFKNAIQNSRNTDIGSKTLAMEKIERPRGLINRNSSIDDPDVIYKESSVVAVYIFALVCNLYNIALMRGDLTGVPNGS